jgi:CBS domain containing-hemolysin-like protein
LQLFAVALLVFANAFFVAAEFSLVSVRRTRITELVAQGNASAESVQKALENPDRVIAATQLGITLASLGLGWIGEPALSHVLEPLVALFPGEMQSEVSRSISAGIAFTIITFLHVVVGELAPKSIALQNPEATSLVVARPTLWTEILFKPVILALNGSGNLLLRLVGIKPASGHQLVHSVEELKMIVSASADEGVVEKDEREMLDAIFDLGELQVGQVMVPRTEILAVEADTALDELLKIVTQTTYTKLPVYEDNLDQIIGILHTKDLLRSLTQPKDRTRIARDLVREAIYVPETIHVRALLQQFRNNRQHIAIVLDEYGGTAGLVTLEDLLEEIVGEVSDPFDIETHEIQALPDGSILIDGRTLIEEVNQQLDLNLTDPYYYTIAGFVLAQLGRIPRAGEIIEKEGLRLRVETMDGLRVASVSLLNRPTALE